MKLTVNDFKKLNYLVEVYKTRIIIVTDGTIIYSSLSETTISVIKEGKWIIEVKLPITIKDFSIDLDLLNNIYKYADVKPIKL